MKRLFVLLGMIFCCFPYTQLIAIESYNQPYAVILCLIVALLHWDQIIAEFPRLHFLSLVALAISGLVLCLVAMQFSGIGAQEGKSLLMYISPLIFAAAAFIAYRHYPVLLPKIIVGAACVWIFVGIIQTLFDVTFATALVGTFEDAASDVVDSGRGTLGLAPEPTHFGFHMLILATALAVIGRFRWVMIACIASSLLLAKSSSALLAIAIGTLLYIVAHRRIGLIPLIFAVPIILGLKVAADNGSISESSRMFVLLNQLLLDPASFIMNDYSVNARLGGLWAGIVEVFRNIFVPQGIANADWLDAIGPVLSRNPWLFSISESGVPSGIVILFYQLGGIAFLLLYQPFKAFFARSESEWQNWLLPVALMIFMGQYLLSTPGFGLIYGLILAKGMTQKTNIVSIKAGKLPAHIFPLRRYAQL
jgi:hypothetical protein